MRNEIGDKIAELRRERGLNQEQLAEKAGVHRVSIAKYETGQNKPNIQTLEKIANALEVTTDEIYGRVERLTPFIGIAKRAVPIVGEVACGTPLTAEENIEGFADLPEGVRADFALKCKGNSMMPTFSEGDLVLIRQQPEVEDGQIAAIGIRSGDGYEATLKRFYRIKDGVLCVSENPAHPPLTFSFEDAPIVYGLAVGYVRMF